MLSRRDMLKALGIGGLLPFVGNKAVEAAPLEVPPVVQAPQEPAWYTLGSATAFNEIGMRTAISGTAMWMPLGTGEPPYGRIYEWTLDLGGDE